MLHEFPACSLMWPTYPHPTPQEFTSNQFPLSLFIRSKIKQTEFIFLSKLFGKNKYEELDYYEL